MRTFVFISDIPNFLLQPIYKNEGTEGGNDAGPKKSLTSSKFDLRYERLRRLLAEHSSGVMLVMHLETKGYALALYASEGEALAACKADITPEQPGQKFPPLRLRILEKEKPRPPEPVYNPYLNVEGEEVRKVDLADTRGLELVYRGRALAKWCPRTLAGEDCHFGVSCLKLHKTAVQRTVRKRPRIDEEDAEAHLSTEQQQLVRRLLACVKEARAALAPASLALKYCIYVPVTQAEMETICGMQADCATEVSSSNDVQRDAIYQAVLQRVEVAMTSSSSSTSFSYFPRLSCPGGAPWDWTVESSEGRRMLRHDCPLPANGAPTPLERDLYIQKLWYHMNQLNRCRTAQEVLRMFFDSRRVREALQRRLRENITDPLFICLQPWLYLPTVGLEVTAFLERGGRRVRGVVQRYGQLRLMTSATLLATSKKEEKGDEDSEDGHDQQTEFGLPQQPHDGTDGHNNSDVDSLLSRYAVLDSGNDSFAEESLSRELRVFQRCIAAAVNDLCRHLQRHPALTGGEGAAWCVRLAVLLPISDATSSPSVSPWSAHLPVDTTTPPVALLSCRAYHRALEECSMYSALAPPASSPADTAADAEKVQRSGKVEVTWNTQRHPYIPLFGREVLEKLRADATE